MEQKVNFGARSRKDDMGPQIQSRAGRVQISLPAEAGNQTRLKIEHEKDYIAVD